MKNTVPDAESKLNLGHFDYDRIARENGGLIPREDIGEILAATKNYPELIDYLLRSWVKNPRRIAISYTGTYCRLLDYRVLPNVELPLFVSRVSGAVLSESWGEHRTGGLANGIFDVCAIIYGLTEKRDFPKVYLIVRKTYEAFKRLPGATEESNQENALETVRYTKELLVPYFRSFFSNSIRQAPKARRLWKVLPLEIREEEFGGSAFTFLRFLEHLAREDRTEKPFRVIEHRYGNKNGSRFRLIGDAHPSRKNPSEG